MFSQNRTLSGTIKDSQNEWLIGATVKLFTKDSALVKGAITDLKGRYRIEDLKNGNYFLKVSSISYQEYKGVSFEISDKTGSIELPIIFMLPAKSTDLNEVVVKSRKPLIEEEIDRTTVNVEAMISAATSNTLEVLERTPSLVVDAQGNISLHGKTGVLVVIDGRSTYMSGPDLVAYLKSLPGSMLEKLELMDNPPAKYEAGGGAIVNIILKKNKALGFTGNTALAVSIGQKARSNNSLNLNYNVGKVNWFGNLGYVYDDNYNKETIERTTFADNGAVHTAYSGNNYSEYNSNALVSRLGADFSFSEKTVLGFQAFYQIRPKTENANYVNNIENAQTAEKERFTGDNLGKIDWNTKGINLNMTQKLKNKGQEISADFNFINYASTAAKDFDILSEKSPSQLFDNLIKGDINIYNFKTDYNHPLPKSARLDAGLKSSFVKNDNDALFNNFMNSIYTVDYTRSNHFIYDENINAAYVNFQKPISKKMSAQLGLRVENTNLLGKLLANQSMAGERFTQNFTNVFPSAFLSYKMGKDDKYTLIANYSKRINRPNYQQFNPFLNYLDAFTYTQGNTEIRPFVLSNYLVRYNYNQKYTALLAYTTADGILGDITIRRGDTFIRKPYNVGTGYQILLNQNFSLKPAKFWNANLNFTVARFVINGSADGQSRTTKFNIGEVAVNNQFSFKNGLSADFNGNYNSADKFYPVTTLSKLRFYLAFQQKLMKNKATLRLNFDDIFHGNFTREKITDFQQTNQYREIVNDTQRVGLAFTYSFGNEKFARKRRHQDNAAQEEQGRVN